MTAWQLNEGLEASLTWVAGAFGSVCAALLVLSVIGELLHRLGRPSVFTQWSKRLSPLWIRHCAGAIAGLLLAVIPLDLATATAATNPAPRSGYATTTTPVATQNDLENRVTSTVAPTTQPSKTAAPAPSSSTTTSTLPELPSEPTTAVSNSIPAPTNSSNPNTDQQQVSSTYEVQPGDCLWAIAAHVLGKQATNVTIDKYWRAIYNANKDLIGSEPNLIFPHQVLALPAINS